MGCYCEWGWGAGMSGDGVGWGGWGAGVSGKEEEKCK